MLHITHQTISFNFVSCVWLDFYEKQLGIFWCLLTLFFHTSTSIDAGKKSRSIWPVPLWQILFSEKQKTRKKHPWPFIVAKALEKELESLLYKCIYLFIWGISSSGFSQWYKLFKESLCSTFVGQNQFFRILFCHEIHLHCNIANGTPISWVPLFKE